MERAEMDETMAVLEINELPGRASINDWALVLGSGCSEGTPELWRTERVTAGVLRAAAVGRRRAAPGDDEILAFSQDR